MRKWKRNTLRSRETRERGVLTVNWIESQTRMLKNLKNMPFYRAKIRNRPIKTIDGYDETVHRGPFRKCRSRPIAMDGPDAIVRETL